MLIESSVAICLLVYPLAINSRIPAWRAVSSAGSDPSPPTSHSLSKSLAMAGLKNAFPFLASRTAAKRSAGAVSFAQISTVIFFMTLLQSIFTRLGVFGQQPTILFRARHRGDFPELVYRRLND